MYEYEREAQAEFLSHLSGDEARLTLCNGIFFFLSHLSGDEVANISKRQYCAFLSHLSGDEVND